MTQHHLDRTATILVEIEVMDNLMPNAMHCQVVRMRHLISILNQMLHTVIPHHQSQHLADLPRKLTIQDSRYTNPPNWVIERQSHLKNPYPLHQKGER